MTVNVVQKPDGYKTTRHQALLEAVDEAVFESDTVCPHCFSRLRHVDSDDDLVEAIDAEEKDRYGVRERYEESTACRNCGQIAGRSESLSVSAAIDRIPALVARLREAGLAVDSDAVFDEVRSQKIDPETAGRDQEIAREASVAGLRAAGEDPR